MRKQLLTVLGLACCGIAFGQTENVAGVKTPAPELNRSVAREAQTVTCGPDTILYPYLKELVFAAPNDSFFVDAMVGNVRTASQAYHTTETVNILGVQFWGGAYSTNPNFIQAMPVMAYLYAVDAMNMPTTVLDSAVVIVGTSYDFYEAMFTVPYSYGQNFAVGVRSQLNDTLAVITNNAGNVWSPNYGESLGWRRFGSGTWNSTASFFGQDLEYMIFPIVSYDVTASYNMADDSACMNDPQAFTNLSSDLYGNRFFNLYAFDDYWGFTPADSSFWWNYGDSPAWSSSFDGNYTYNTSGNYTVTLAAEIIGYYTSCVDSFSMQLEVMPLVTSNFSYDNSAEPTIAFMDASTGATSYWWDFGDSTTSTSANPSHTYAGMGTYAVTLITYGYCGTDTTTQVLYILGSNVQSNTGVVNTAWYSEADGALNLTLGADAATVEIVNANGALISSANDLPAGSMRLSTGDLAAGVYFVRILNNDSVSVLKFAVTE